MTQAADEADLIRVVLADANVLYSRVLRDYLLYRGRPGDHHDRMESQDPRRGHGSPDGKPWQALTKAGARRLVGAMNGAFPLAEVEPGEQHWHMLAGVALPDEDDRHVLAATLAAEATVLCTSNTKDFPTDVVAALGVEVLTADELLSRLVAQCQPQMLAAHRTAVASLKGATDASTVAALHRSGASTTAALMAGLLGVDLSGVLGRGR